MIIKSLFTPKEAADISLAVFKVHSDQDLANFLSRLERIFLDKLYESGESERLLGLGKGS